MWLGRAVTAEERSNAVKIYSMVMGSAGSGTFNGAYEPGGNAPMELEVSMFTDPATKNSADLAIYAASAWNSGWGYGVVKTKLQGRGWSHWLEVPGIKYD